MGGRTWCGAQQALRSLAISRDELAGASAHGTGVLVRIEVALDSIGVDYGHKGFEDYSELRSIQNVYLREVETAKSDAHELYRGACGHVGYRDAPKQRRALLLRDGPCGNYPDVHQRECTRRRRQDAFPNLGLRPLRRGRVDYNDRVCQATPHAKL